MLIIDHPDQHFKLTAVHYFIWPSQKTTNMAGYLKERPNKAEFVSDLKLVFFFFYSNINHTDPQRYAIPDTKGTVTESNKSHEKYYCTFCTVHCNTHLVNGYSDAY